MSTLCMYDNRMYDILNGDTFTSASKYDGALIYTSDIYYKERVLYIYDRQINIPAVPRTIVGIEDEVALVFDEFIYIPDYGRIYFNSTLGVKCAFTFCTFLENIAVVILKNYVVIVTKNNRYEYELEDDVMFVALKGVNASFMYVNIHGRIKYWSLLSILESPSYFDYNIPVTHIGINFVCDTQRIYSKLGVINFGFCSQSKYDELFYYLNNYQAKMGTSNFNIYICRNNEQHIIEFYYDSESIIDYRILTCRKRYMIY